MGIFLKFSKIKTRWAHAKDSLGIIYIYGILKKKGGGAFFFKCRKRNATYFLKGHRSGSHILTHGFVFKFLKVQKFF